MTCFKRLATWTLESSRRQTKLTILSPSTTLIQKKARQRYRTWVWWRFWLNSRSTLSTKTSLRETSRLSRRPKIWIGAFSSSSQMPSSKLSSSRTIRRPQTSRPSHSIQMQRPTLLRMEIRSWACSSSPRMRSSTATTSTMSWKTYSKWRSPTGTIKCSTHAAWTRVVKKTSTLSDWTRLSKTCSCSRSWC